jgi:post-segregation antitoxin (ccd killing protein)
MSGVKHTAGPWMAADGPSSVVGWPVVGPMGRSICNVSWMPKKAYPDVSDTDYAAFNAECEANARLIAAAPELLTALKRQQANISRWLETGIPADPEESKSISGQIDAAIAKAEGRTP